MGPLLEQLETHGPRPWTKGTVMNASCCKDSDAVPSAAFGPATSLRLPCIPVVADSPVSTDV